MSRITPTVGRKLYYHGVSAGDPTAHQVDDQPLDATIVYVSPEGTLNLVVFDHLGCLSVRHGVPLIQEDDAIPQGGYAQWMPYQIGQAAKNTSTQSSATSVSEPQIDAPPVAATPESLAAFVTKDAPSENLMTNPTPVEAAGAPVAHTADAGEDYDSSFGGALLALKAGKKVTRSGWNGKGMFVYLVPAAAYPAQTGAAKSHFGEGAYVPYNPYLAIKNANETVSTWVPSVNDCLAGDWVVLD